MMTSPKFLLQRGAAAKLAALFATLASIAALTGCSAFNPVGESTFDCNRKENPSAYCRSFKALEKSTNGELPQSRFDKEFSMSEYDRATGIAPLDQDTAHPAAGTSSKDGKNLPLRVRLPYSDPLAGAPVRNAPVIQRTWVKRFVDSDDMLRGDTIVYQEVRSAKWSGFDTVVPGGEDSAGIAPYPHKPRNSPMPGIEETAQPKRSTNVFVQPDSGRDSLEDSALQPAASGSNTSMPK